MSDDAAQNTDRVIWRAWEGDYYADSIHVTKEGAIGINVGGTVYVMPVRDWHKLATLRAALVPPADDEIGAIRARQEAALARMADNNWPMSEGRQDVAALLEMVDRMRADQ